jgi:hypothetical protein
MDRYLNRPLDHDSVWSFIRGADAQQLRMIERQTATIYGFQHLLRGGVGAMHRGHCTGA